MSRSRKKFPCSRGGACSKFGKRWCNKRVRQACGDYQNGEYRKIGNDFYIWDWMIRKSPEEMRDRDWEDKKDYISK